MNEEDLELLITLDDPEDPEKEDTFHLQAEPTVGWPEQSSPARRRPNRGAGATNDNDPK